MFALFSSLHMYSDWGLLALRLAIGAVFLYHCRSKFSAADYMFVIGCMELVGGLSLILGLLTPLGALLLAIVMAGAIYKKVNEWHVPFSAMDKMGWEFDLSLLGGCLAILTLGGGTIALDYMLFGIY